METTQQIMLIVLSFCVWVIGGLAVLTLLGAIMYFLIYAFCKSFGSMNKAFLSFLHWKYFSKNFGIQKEYYFFLENEEDVKAILKEIKKVKLDKGL